MALDYSIECAIQQETLSQLLGEIFKKPITPETSDPFTAEGIRCELITPTEGSQEMILANCGFRPNASLHCRIEKFEANSPGIQFLLDLCSRLVAEEDVSFVLLNKEALTPLMICRNSKVQLNPNDQWWRDKLSAHFSAAKIRFKEYEMKPMA